MQVGPDKIQITTCCKQLNFKLCTRGRLQQSIKQLSSIVTRQNLNYNFRIIGARQALM